jgi:flavin reductase (DIM6/NTAB) family NADH-FMN oxidoreductase RutF
MIAASPSEVDIPASETLPPESFWRAAGHFPTGVSVLTLGRGEKMHGTTVSAFTVVSCEPPLVSVCLRSTGSSVALVTEADSFAINVLASGQARLARHFASRNRGGGRQQFEHVAWRDEFDLPVLEDVVCCLRCVPVQAFPAGDHHVVLAEVHGAFVTEGTPLLCFAGRLHPGAIDTHEEKR